MLALAISTAFSYPFWPDGSGSDDVPFDWYEVAAVILKPTSQPGSLTADQRALGDYGQDFDYSEPLPDPFQYQRALGDYGLNDPNLAFPPTWPLTQPRIDYASYAQYAPYGARSRLREKSSRRFNGTTVSYYRFAVPKRATRLA